MIICLRIDFICHFYCFYLTSSSLAIHLFLTAIFKASIWLFSILVFEDILWCQDLLASAHQLLRNNFRNGHVSFGIKIAFFLQQWGIRVEYLIGCFGLHMLVLTLF